MRIIGGTVMALCALSAQASLAQPAKALKPTHITGPGVYVRDLEAQKAWYMQTLGFSLLRSYDRDGKPFEYVLGLDDGPDRAVLVLAASANRPEGDNRFSRLILLAPDAKALAAELGKRGIAAREAVPNVAYFIRDPEGNPVELYTPPKP